MRIRGNLILCAAGAAGLFAQQGSIGGPVAGYVFDSHAQSLRVIRGIPGASLIGSGVDLGAGVTAAWVSPKLDSALAVMADGSARIFRLSAGSAVPQTVEGVVAPERAVFSPSGAALALVTPGSVRIVKGLPDAPTVAGTVELPVERGAAPSAAMAAGKLRRPGGGAVAVSDDGLYLLYVSGRAVQILGIGGESRKLADVAPNALPAFAPGGHDAAIVDAESVSLFQDAAGAATVRKLPGVAGGRGVAFAPDGKRLFVAGAAVTSLDMTTGDRAEIACDCRPSGLVRMGSVFRLNDLGSGPLWLLDAVAEPRVVFVPAAQ